MRKFALFFALFVLNQHVNCQVKVRGQRVELEEIESLLKSSPGVTEAAVLLASRGDEPVLFAFLCSSKDGSASLRGKVQQASLAAENNTLWCSLALTSPLRFGMRTICRICQLRPMLALCHPGTP